MFNDVWFHGAGKNTYVKVIHPVVLQTIKAAIVSAENNLYPSALKPRLGLPEFLDNRHTKVARLSTLCFTPRDDPWYSFPLQAEPTPGP